MTFLSRATIALGLASPLFNINSVAADNLMRVIVSYNGEKARESIASQTLALQGEGIQVQEVSNHEFSRAQKVIFFGFEDVSMEGWVQEGAMSTGYSVMEFDSSSSDINAEMEALKDVPGVVAVEKDGVMHALSLPTQNGKNLRERGGQNQKDMQMQDILDTIKTTADKFPKEEGVDHDHRRRRLVEDTPYGITMVGSAYVNDKTPPVGAQNITICVVDTGYDLGHEDLPNSADHGVDGYSPYGSSQLWDVDGDGHGTHCAGTIGAIGDNDVGVTSVNPDPTKFKFYIGKGLEDSGSGTSSGVMSAINACVNNGAKVISMSLGGSGSSTSFDNLVKDHYDNGGEQYQYKSFNMQFKELSQPFH